MLLWRRGRLGCGRLLLMVGVMGVVSPLLSIPDRAAAQTAPAAGNGSFADTMEAVGLKAKVAPPPDFVVKSRPDPSKLNYLPVGTTHPERPIKVMTPAEIAATTADLDSTRMNQQRRAGLKPPPVPLKTQKVKAPTKKTVP